MQTAVFVFFVTLAIQGTQPNLPVAQQPEPIRYENYHPVTTGRFANFTFAAQPVFSDSLHADRRRSLKLRLGIFEPHIDAHGYIDRLGAYLESVLYEDVTGDGQDEAIVVLGSICDCTAERHGVYIYGLAANRPKLLWAFTTGDRAYGGLHQAYANSGQLVVETYGTGSGPGKAPTKWSEVSCCAEAYTRRQYRWTGQSFRQVHRATVVDLPH